MKLDCIKKGDGWIIIDHDNGCREFVESDDVEGAWYKAAMELEIMINDAKRRLST